MSTAATLLILDRVIAVGMTLVEMKALSDKIRAAQAAKGADLTPAEVDAILDIEAAKVAAATQAKIDAMPD